MVRVILNITIALALLALGPRPAMAAHPLRTDDAGTLGRGTIQLELGSAASRERARRDGRRVREEAGELAVSLGAGLRDDLDLTMGAPYVWSRVALEGGEAEETEGLGDLTVELKWQARIAGGFSLALKPGLTLPTGDARRGLGAGRPCFTATAVLSQGLGPLSVHANLGYLRDEYARSADRRANRADRLRASAAAIVQPAPWLRVAAEAALERDPDRRADRWQATALAAAISSVAEDLELDVGVEVGLTSAADDLTGLAGLTWRF